MTKMSVITETAQELGRLKSKILFIKAVMDIKAPDKFKLEKIKKVL